MREIKFRAWDAKQKIMCYEVDIYSRPHETVTWWTGQHRYPAGNKADFFDNGGKDNVLMQFSGLKDKNGTQIWEDDICRQNFSGKITIGDVRIEPTRGAVLSGHTPIWPHDIEVLGNQYEHPELLKGAKSE